MLLERGDHFRRRRSAAHGEANLAVATDAEHGALNALPVLLERAVRAGDRAVIVDEERKVELELRRVLRVALDAGRISIGEALVDFRGILTGVPVYEGPERRQGNDKQP